MKAISCEGKNAWGVKKLNEIYKQYEGLIKLIIMVAPLAFASWKYLGTYINVPDRMDAFEQRAQRDSIFYWKIIQKNIYNDSIQYLYLKEDLDSIVAINEKLKRNFIN